MAEKKPVAKKAIVKKAVAKKAVAKPKISAAMQLAQVAARAADEKQGSEITVLNVGDVLAITELFVVATASNSRQVGAIQSEVSHKVREKLGRSPLRSEGTVSNNGCLLTTATLWYIFLLKRHVISMRSNACTLMCLW